ncbi:MAG: V-type ATP synthase subunit E [Proteobacteria bacterium]|nr:V-type ATP synthase subunit E [Pseudomonadota bacterium]
MTGDKAPASSRQRLIESLWEDARREAQQQVEKARSEAENLLGESQRFFERQMALADMKAREEALPHVSRTLNQARNRTRQFVLEERLGFLNSCLDEVAGKTSREESFAKKTRAAFERLLDDALSAMGDAGKIDAAVNPEDAARARSILDGKGIGHDLVEDGNITGGALLKARGGTMVVDNTIEGRLRVLRETPPVDLLRLMTSQKVINAPRSGRPNQGPASEVLDS